MSHKKIQKAIDVWFEDTQKLITEASTKDKSLSLTFCTVAVSAMKIYCRAASFLLDEGFKLPSMALIRVISEFLIKYLWCINSDDENEIRIRLQRWDKTSGKKKLKLHESLLDLKEGVLDKESLKKIEESKEKLEEALNGNNAGEMPSVTGKGGLFESTSGIFGDNVSAILYSQYCSAVHIDTSILSGLIQKSDGLDLGINEDICENIGELKKRCVNFAYMFLLLVHKKNRWDITAIEQEYKSMIEELSVID